MWQSEDNLELFLSPPFEFLVALRLSGLVAGTLSHLTGPRKSFFIPGFSEIGGHVNQRAGEMA